MLLDHADRGLGDSASSRLAPFELLPRPLRQAAQARELLLEQRDEFGLAETLHQ